MAKPLGTPESLCGTCLRTVFLRCKKAKAFIYPPRPLLVPEHTLNRERHRKQSTHLGTVCRDLWRWLGGGWGVLGSAWQLSHHLPTGCPASSLAPATDPQSVTVPKAIFPKHQIDQAFHLLKTWPMAPHCFHNKIQVDWLDISLPTTFYASSPTFPAFKPDSRQPCWLWILSSTTLMRSSYIAFLLPEGHSKVINKHVFGCSMPDTADALRNKSQFLSSELSQAHLMLLTHFHISIFF